MSIEPDATALRRITRAGDYDLLRKMGSGGFGVVYEARHRHTGLLYAVKRIELSLEDAERFRKEALYPAQIASRSLHVLGVHSFFHDPVTDAFYLVTELIPHGDLKAFLAQRPKPLALAQALHLGSGIAKGLAAIHALGIVHRDLKPANVLMDKKDGQWVPKIADFGLARSHSSVSIGEFASSGYASPEQLDLLSDRPVGTESDLFSFGMVLYELLTGERPSTATDLREYGRWIKDRRPPPPPSTVRPELSRFVAIDTLLASLIEFEPTRRTTSAATCTKVLQDALLALARPNSPRPPSSQPHIQAAPPPIPTPLPIPAPIASPVPRSISEPLSAPSWPAPTPAPLPLAAPVPGFVPPERSTPAVMAPAAKRRSGSRGLGWILALVAVAGLAVLGGAGWFGWRLYDLRDAATRGQEAFRGYHFGKALPLLKKAAESGDAASQGLLGEIYAMGLGVPSDDKEARRWFELAAAQDHPSGIAGRGWALLYGYGTTADPERGVVLLRQAAERGDSFGHAYLGMAYENGMGTARNETEAARQYQLAAEQHAMAAYRLARMYRDGRGVGRSADDALTWARKAADVGYYNGMCLLGNLLGARYEQARTANRLATPPDTDAREAVKWYRKAAEDQIPCGELGLGYMYYYGYGIDESYDQAVTFYERAAGHGDETAKSNLTDAMGHWVLPPLFLGNWRQVGGEERREEIQRLRSAGIVDRLGARDVQRLRRIEIDFYDRATLFELEIARPNRANGIYAYIRRGDRVVPIDGRSAPIHEQNGTAPVRLDTVARAMEYLRFFMAAIQSAEGTFRLVDESRDVAWLSTATDQDRSGIAGQISPASMSPSSSGGWQAVVSAQHGNAVFQATMWVKPNGDVEMLDDKPIGAMLPIAQERFDDQGLRVRVSN
jgi:serine/threonine protein kinase/TPR repeat protein